MKSLVAIKKFMGTQGNNPEMTYTEPKVTEMKQFLDVCTPDEKRQFGKDACDAMGETFEE